MTTIQVALTILAVSALAGAGIFIYLIWIVPDAECADISQAEAFAGARQAAAGLPAGHMLHSFDAANVAWKAPEQMMIASFINLENLADDLMQPTSPRDEQGHCSHPALPVFAEGTDMALLLESIGLAAAAVCMESDCENSDLKDWVWEGNSCLEWTPTTPAGEGWNLLEIYDPEDGPHALFVRRLTNDERRERTRHRRETKAVIEGYQQRVCNLIEELDSLCKYAENKTPPSRQLTSATARRALKAIVMLQHEIDLLKADAKDAEQAALSAAAETLPRT